jgi:hypothetical protein
MTIYMPSTASARKASISSAHTKVSSRDSRGARGTNLSLAFVFGAFFQALFDIIRLALAA